MNFVGIDLEGVLIPEIWVSLAEKTGINELKLTTKDIIDYKELMKIRIDLLKKKEKLSHEKRKLLRLNLKIKKHKKQERLYQEF